MLETDAEPDDDDDIDPDDQRIATEFYAFAYNATHTSSLCFETTFYTLDLSDNSDGLTAIDMKQHGVLVDIISKLETTATWMDG